MEKDEHEAQSIVSELRAFMSSRENIAKMSQKDSVNASEIKNINQSSKEEFATEFVNQKQIDHIVPFSKGGKTNIENLRTLCKDCTLGKRDKI